MKKYLLLILILLMPTWAWGANWFAGSGDTDFDAQDGSHVSSVWNSNADGTSGTYLDFDTGPGNGDVFIANGATIAIDDNIGSGSVTVTLTTEGTDYGGTDGGNFSIAINSVDALTLYTNITGGSTRCLLITGAGSSGTELTLRGNITGGTASSAHGVDDTHTGAGAIVAVIGNIVGGTGVSSAYGYNFNSASGSAVTTIDGNATGGQSPALYIANDASATISGNCVGSDTYWSGHGCYSNHTGIITVSGSIISQNLGSGAVGPIIWTPSSSQKYIVIDGGGTPLYASAGIGSDSGGTQVSAANTAAEIATGKYFVKKDDGVHTQGTKTAGSGGGASAW